MDRITCHGLPRGSRPDATARRAIYLFKKVSRLRLTFQIRSLTEQARGRDMQLVLRVPHDTLLSPDLERFMLDNHETIAIERV